MELREYIDMGAQKAGTLTKLGNLLGLTQPQISTIKSHKKPLPDTALVKLAEYINVPERELIAANNIAMGKHVDFWRPFVQHAKAASIALVFSLVTNFVTPSPAEAAQTQHMRSERLCIMLIRRIIRHLKERQLTRTIKPIIQGTLEALQAFFAPRVTQV